MPEAILYVCPDGTATTVTVVATLTPCRPSVVTVSELEAACAAPPAAADASSAATPATAIDLRRTLIKTPPGPEVGQA
ncbi:hypothetical protein SGRIM119S_08555 [Streptomyces griseorubiginosus]